MSSPTCYSLNGFLGSEAPDLGTWTPRWITLNPKALNPKTLNPKTLNPKTLNPKTLNPKPESPKPQNPEAVNPKTLNREVHLSFLRLAKGSKVVKAWVASSSARSRGIVATTEQVSIPKSIFLVDPPCFPDVRPLEAFSTFVPEP